MISFLPAFGYGDAYETPDRRVVGGVVRHVRRHGCGIEWGCAIQHVLNRQPERQSRENTSMLAGVVIDRGIQRGERRGLLRYRWEAVGHATCVVDETRRAETSRCPHHADAAPEPSWIEDGAGERLFGLAGTGRLRTVEPAGGSARSQLTTAKIEAVRTGQIKPLDPLPCRVHILIVDDRHHLARVIGPAGQVIEGGVVRKKLLNLFERR